MRFYFVLVVFCGVLGLAACSPALNWREVRPELANLTLLLPCKPDRGSREVPLGGQPITLRMVGCDASGATFALAHAELGLTGEVDAALRGWRSATLSNLRGEQLREQAARVAGTGAQGAGVDAVRVSAQGMRADGSRVQSEALYFSSGRHVYQAVIYAPRLTPEMSDMFFQSLRLQ